MVALTVTWSLLLAIAPLLLVVGGAAGPLAIGCFACSGLTAAVTIVVIGVQLGVGALRWHLDPSSRYVPVPAEYRPARADF